MTGGAAQNQTKTSGHHICPWKNSNRSWTACSRAWQGPGDRLPGFPLGPLLCKHPPHPVPQRSHHYDDDGAMMAVTS